MGTQLRSEDEFTHPVGSEKNWNESRYFDAYDPVRDIGAWFRIGMRPNEGYAEMSACAYLPGDRVAFFFARAPIDGNCLVAGGQEWEVVEPYRENRVTYRGEMALLEDPWELLADPGKVFRDRRRTGAEFDLRVFSNGLGGVMGQDQDQIDRIFVPGQADFHYQHLARVAGTFRVGKETFEFDGRGGKDHSWGPRNWHAKIYLRWLICGVDDENGFMLCRAVGPTKKTHGGFVLEDGEFHLVDDYKLRNSYADAPHHELRQTDVTINAGSRSWEASGTPRHWLPVRHRSKAPDGTEAMLRIVKSPSVWAIDGKPGIGHNEYHDLLEEGKPVGLDD